VRLSGIYALERIARDSARDHPAVMEVLSAYVREHVPSSTCPGTASPAGPTTDVQAILTIIGRRDQNRDLDYLALSGICLSNANLYGANLTGADLTGTRGLDEVRRSLTKDGFVSQRNR
jgi:Pentapeptide repeats (8 copies)